MQMQDDTAAQAEALEFDALFSTRKPRDVKVGGGWTGWVAVGGGAMECRGTVPFMPAYAMEYS